MANDFRGRPWIIDTAQNPLVGIPFRTITHGFVVRDYNTNPASGPVISIVDGVRGITIAELWGNAGLTPAGEAWYQEQHILKMGVIVGTGVTSFKLEVIIV